MARKCGRGIGVYIQYTSNLIWHDHKRILLHLVSNRIEMYNLLIPCLMPLIVGEINGPIISGQLQISIDL